MHATMSLYGLYNYDNTLFDNMVLPDIVDKNSFINKLCYDTAGMRVLYADPRLMKEQIGLWSRQHLFNWNKLAAVYEADYNPIHNYDRTEEGADSDNLTRNMKHSKTGSDTHSHDGTDNYNNTRTDNLQSNNTETHNLTNTNDFTRDLTTVNDNTVDTNNNVENGGSDVTTNSSVAYNAGMTDREKTTVNPGSTQESTGKQTETLIRDETGTSNNTVKDTGTLSNEGSNTGTVTNEASNTYGSKMTDSYNNILTESGTDEREMSHQLRAYGNIGVTTSQQMLTSEIELWGGFNLYDYIIREFKKEFCILIY